MELTKSEMEIMDVFWNSKLPLSRSDLLGHGEEKSWKDSSVCGFECTMFGLLQKGALSEVGFVRRNKTYGRTFLPTLSREEYFASTIFCHRYKPDMKGLLVALLERPEADFDVVEYLRNLLNNK